jgi:hypothetical protein
LIHFELIHRLQCSRNRNTRANASPQKWLVLTRNSLAGFTRKLTPPLPDKLPGPEDEPQDPVDILNLIEVRKRAAKLPPIEDVSEFIVKPLVKPKMLIQGILHQGSKMSLGAGSKSFKTWMLMDLALSVACGVPWLGFNTTKAKVLYCNFEIQQEFMQDRIKAIERAKEITSEPGSMDIWNLRGHAAPYDVIIPMILERIKEKDYGLMIVDPLYKIYGDTDENSAGDMADLMNELERLAVKAKAAVVFGAHFSKGNQANKDSIERVSGSGVYGRDPDSIVTFTRHEEEDAFAMEMKLRNLQPMKPFVVRWQYPLMVRDDCLNPAKLKTGISKKAIYTVDDLIKVVAVESRTKKELKEIVIQATGMSESTFNTLFRKFEASEGVTFTPQTQKYCYANPNGGAKPT